MLFLLPGGEGQDEGERKTQTSTSVWRPPLNCRKGGRAAQDGTKKAAP